MRVALRGNESETAAVGRPRDLQEAAALVARAMQPPFTVYSVGAQDGQLHLGVPREEVTAAKAFFMRRPLHLADGTAVPLRIEGLRAGGGSPTQSRERHGTRNLSRKRASTSG